MPALFDPDLRAIRRDRAARIGPALFLHERAFDDILERLAMMNRKFDSTLLVGCPDPGWIERLASLSERVDARDPGPLFAASFDTAPIREDTLDAAPASFDLIIALGTLDTVDDLPGALLRLALALRPGGLLIGAMSGGDTLPALRSAMQAADRTAGAAQAHIHPRIEASALAPLLDKVGLARPVVDVDRVRVTYSSFRSLVADLRAMGATNILNARPRTPILRRALAAAESAFSGHAIEGRTTETFEILHFAAWSGEAGRT